MKRALVAFRGRLDHELRPHSVTTAQLEMLHAISLVPGGSGADLARLCHITPQTAQVLLTRAVRRGWITRGKAPNNNRLVTAELTPAGHDLLAHAREIAERLQAEMWHGITLDQMEQLNTLLARALSQLGEPE